MTPSISALVAALTAASVFALGSIWFGHFERGLPKWRRALKLALTQGIPAATAYSLGLAAGLALLGVLVVVGLTGHFLWCSRNGIDPWTAEPWERYARLRGWL